MNGVRGIAIMILCMNLMLVLGGFNLIDIGANSYVDKFVNYDLDSEDISMGGNLTNAVPNNLADGTGLGTIGTTISFFNVFSFIWDALVFLTNLTFAPIAIFTSIPNIPFVIPFLIGIPLLAAYVLGFIWFIRGGND